MKNNIILFAFALLSSTATKAEGIGQSAFLRIVDEVASNNLTVIASKAQDASLNASLAVSNRLPAPEVTFGHLWGHGGIGNKWNIEVSQSLDWPGLYRARREVNRRLADVSAASVANSLYEARCNTAKTLINVIYYTKLTDLYTSNLCRVDSLLDLYNRGFKMGEISILDVNKLKIDRIAANRALVSAREGLVESTTTLRELNNNEPTEAILAQLDEFPEINLMPLHSYVAEAVRCNAELNNKLAQARAAQANVKVSKLERYPGLTVGINHEYEMGENFNGVSVGITLPFLTSGKNVIAAQLEQRALEAETEVLQTAIEANVRGLYDKAVLLYDEGTQYAKVLADDDSVRLLNLALRQGHITLIDYMLQVNFFTEAKATYLQVESDYLQAAIALYLQIHPAAF